MALFQLTKTIAFDKILPEFRGFRQKEAENVIREIQIKDLSQVERINQLACQAPYEVWLSTDTVLLDARSLMGLYALVGKRAHVVAEDDVNPKAFGKLVAQMA